MTPRQNQIAKRLAEGATRKQAAAELGVSPKTVEYHAWQIERQLPYRFHQKHPLVVLTHLLLNRGEVKNMFQL